MEKRKLSAIPRMEATPEMVEMADRMPGIKHMVTAELVEDSKILLLNFFEVSKLKKGKTEAAFRTFLSSDDYITQDLSVSKVKWLTAAFDNMQNFRVFEYKWDGCKSQHIPLVFIWSATDKETIEKFFKTYSKKDDESVWNAIGRFQDKVKASRLEEKHRKVLAPIDLKMEPIVEPPQEFRDWVWEYGMSFSRYGIYKETSKGKAEFECTYCKKIGVVDRSKVRLRNNEKGECPFCGSKVTYKARGKMPYQIVDERWFIYVDRQEKGFLLRYFNAKRHIKNDACIETSIFKKRIEESLFEYSRSFWTFVGNTPMKESYEWGVYHQRGLSRWIPDEGNIACMESILYPGNLPQAWEHTPMKYSALEILAQNIPTTAFRYEDALDVYLKFPKLEWLQDKKAAAEKKRREKLAAKKMAETKKAMEEIFSRNDGVDAFQIKGKGLILVVPQSGDEIRKEGEALHHCVGGYVDRVARGETNIFFIRKADHPEKSYFTMEWRDNKIIQCRGFKNCGMPADVQAFVKVFEKKMNEAIQGDNKKNAERKAG